VISVENRKILHPRVLCASLTGFRLELDIGAWSHKTRMMGYRAQKEVWRYLQTCGFNTPTWQTTDKWTDRHRTRDDNGSVGQG